jgi:signal transduction histidine kinase
MPSRLHSVRGRLFLLIAALLVPALGIIAALSWEAFRTQRATVRAELINTARAVAGLVDTEVARSSAMLDTFSGARSLRDGDWATLDQTARRVLTDSKRWLVVVGMDGRQVINTRLPRGAAIPNVALDPAYVAAMQSGQTYVSNLVHGPAAQALVVHVGRPVRHENGTLYGLSIVMVPDALREALEVQRFAPDGVLSIVDRTGRIIVRNPYRSEFIGKPATSDMVRAINERDEGVGESVTLEGIPVITAFMRARCGWSVLIGSPKAKVTAASRRLLAIGLGSAFAVTAAAMAMAMWIARAVVRSVDGLAQEAEQLARGETPAARPDELQEIATVALAMRRMAATRSDAEGQLREARDRLREYAQELERKVDERTASLREAVAQMEEFSYTVSHDLRGPLRAMTTYATVLLEDYAPSLDPQAQEYLQRIVRASERMNRLTSDLLTYSRVARADLQRAPVNLEPIVRGALDHYGELSPRVADVTLVTPMQPVLAHEPALAQALTNLLTNAAKFVRPGERPRITVRTERRGPRVRVWVEDNGIGIPAGHQEKLFRIFERTPAAVKYDGTGVGLAIVRKIVEKTGGACGVESDGTTGSRFWIELESADAVAVVPQE